jgi:predicted nucleic acid-binding protein
MGILNAIQGNQVYLDTNVWIYALEAFPTYVQELTTLLQAIDQGNLLAVTSELSLAEVLVKPIQNQNVSQQNLYKQALSTTPNLQVVPVQRDILIEAAQLRASINLKLPDAIHAATAIRTQCSSLLTNDQKFQSVPGLHIILLSQIISP